ncbi:hypothetical protein [Pseudoduganella lutea]|uniref:Uncharacterized protein n=1 Tax=Pseudoduganella lutea TaxID=321985 RepID=A0A4P6KW45_9BURK|nr:hypothetical protein [Pseudoduganella lutea]QBE62915.1 hypothetical protein EWM63_07975 [Pseudoduganella lutea]
MQASLFAPPPTEWHVTPSASGSAIALDLAVLEHAGTVLNASPAVVPVVLSRCHVPCVPGLHESHLGKQTMQELRRNALVSRQVETGMIFMEMLGIDDARAYWRAANIPDIVIERLVNGHPGRVPPPLRSEASSAVEIPADTGISLFYCSAGRRQDLIGAAVVQAAIAVSQELGRDRAERMLRREGLGADVIDRVLSREGGGRRIA